MRVAHCVIALVCAPIILAAQGVRDNEFLGYFRYEQHATRQTVADGKIKSRTVQTCAGNLVSLPFDNKFLAKATEAGVDYFNRGDGERIVRGTITCADSSSAPGEPPHSTISSVQPVGILSSAPRGDSVVISFGTISAEVYGRSGPGGLQRVWTRCPDTSPQYAFERTECEGHATLTRATGPLNVGQWDDTPDPLAPDSKGRKRLIAVLDDAQQAVMLLSFYASARQDSLFYHDLDGIPFSFYHQFVAEHPATLSSFLGAALDRATTVSEQLDGITGIKDSTVLSVRDAMTGMRVKLIPSLQEASASTSGNAASLLTFTAILRREIDQLRYRYRR